MYKYEVIWSRLKSKVWSRSTRDKDLQEILSGTFWTVIQKAIGLFAAFVFSFVVARTLGAESWGAYILSLTVLSFATIIALLGVDTAFMRLAAQFSVQGREEDVRAVYLMSLRLVVATALILTVAIYLLASVIATEIFHKPNLTIHIRIASLAILPLALSNLNWQGLRGLKKIKEYAFFSLTARHLLPLLLFLILVALITSGSIVIVSLVISTYVIAITSTLRLIKYGRFREVEITSGLTYRVLLNISLPLMFAASLGFVRGWISIFMLGVFVSESDVGVYSVAVRLAAFISIVLTATGGIAAPKMAESFGRSDRQGLGKTARWVSQLSLYAALPVFVALVLVPRFWLGMFGSEFRVAVAVLLVLSFVYLFDAWSGATGLILQMTNHQIFYQNITLAVVVLEIVLNIILIPRYGILGAAASVAVSIVAWNLICAIYIKIRLDISVFYNPLKSLSNFASKLNRLS